MGHVAFALSDQQRSDALRALAILAPHNLTLEDAARLAARQAPQMKEQLTVSELFQRFIAAPGHRKSKALHRRPRSITNIKWRAGRFQKSFGNRKASDVRTEEVQAWMLSLGELSPVSLNNFRRVLHALFAFGVSEGYCLSNPIAKVPLFSVPATTPSILAVDDAGRLVNAALASNGTLGLLGYITLGLFAGLRRAELERLDWRAVKWERQMVTVDGDIAKSGSIRNVALSDNAMKWLKLCGATVGSLKPRNINPKLREVRRLAGIEKWEGNELRHSFASYHFDLHQNGPLTAAQLGHSSGCHLLFAHYRSLVPLGEGRKYFAISPPTSTVQPEKCATDSEGAAVA
jgi:integrase